MDSTDSATLGLEDPAFRIATAEDVEALVSLINAAYRGESSRQGWTTEADLLDGLRTDRDMLLKILAAADSVIVLYETGQQLLGSVHLQREGSKASLGMLAVKPDLQGQGIGTSLLMAAETHAASIWPIHRMAIRVIDCRAELLAFYQRRNYRLTGDSEVFPENPRLWQPKVKALRLLTLEKTIKLSGKIPLHNEGKASRKLRQ